MTNEGPLKRVGKDLRVFFVQFIKQLILDTPGQSSSKTSGKSGRACPAA